MPYGEDGETWDIDYRRYEEGMAENRPGHKAFVDYKLPSWAIHPLTHPGSGITVGVKDYAYASTDRGTGTALDGIGNHLQNSPAHIAAQYGDMEMLESCTPSQLNARDVNGKTTTHYAMDAGTSWVVQWLAEKKCDITSEALLGDKRMHPPEDLIYINSRLHTKEMEWLDLALKGELSDKKSQEAQEYKLVRWRQESLDPIVTEFLDNAHTKLQQRMHFYKTGDFQMPYPMPTDAEIRAKMDMPTAKVPQPPPKAKPPLPVALMFPGQGSQGVGMMKDCLQIPAVQAMLVEAKRILKFDVKEIVLNTAGLDSAVAQAKLDEPKHAQVALFLAGMAAVEVMKKEGKADMVERAQAVAGLSVGEYTALCVAGVLPFDEILRLLKVRSEAMQKAISLRPQTTCSVAGLDRANLEKCCKEAIALGLDAQPVCQIASSLFNGGYLVAGTKNTVDKLCVLAKSAKALQAKVVPNSGGFHSPLMAPALAEFSAAIEAIKPKMCPPRCAVYFNTGAQKVNASRDPSSFDATAICELLKKQLVSEVSWDTLVKQLIMDGVKDFFECGPRNQLKNMMKRIDQDAFKRTENVTV